MSRNREQATPAADIKKTDTVQRIFLQQQLERSRCNVKSVTIYKSIRKGLPVGTKIETFQILARRYFSNQSAKMSSAQSRLPWLILPLSCSPTKRRTAAGRNHSLREWLSRSRSRAQPWSSLRSHAPIGTAKPCLPLDRIFRGTMSMKAALRSHFVLSRRTLKCSGSRAVHSTHSVSRKGARASTE